MSEQSHLEAMREAIKGDLERARSRRASVFERPAPPPLEIRAAPVPPPVAEPEPEPVAVEPEPVAEEPVVEEPVVAAEPAPEPERSFWSRLVFWR